MGSSNLPRCCPNPKCGGSVFESEEERRYRRCAYTVKDRDFLKSLKISPDTA